MTRLISFLPVAAACFGVTAADLVSDVTARQRYPWNGKVDITFNVNGDLTEACSGQGRPFLLVTARDATTGRSWTATAPEGQTGHEEGFHHVVWDMKAEGITLDSTNVVFTVAYEALHDYCTVDLSGGEDATDYPVGFLRSEPAGGWTDVHKTDSLVLRLVAPGTFKAGGTTQTVISRPFYCGIFEVTQKQYELVTGDRPSACAGDTRPVEHVSWASVRGRSDDGYDWPYDDVHPKSFAGLLRKKSGVPVDLPSEAQWEYACRAGTTGVYGNGGSTEADLARHGRYKGNQDDGRGGGYEEHTTVGSYEPNGFGLYDMHGNVEEWCLDWLGSGFPGGSDPLGPQSGSYRTARGGSWSGTYDNCTASSRMWQSETMRMGTIGFRLVADARELTSAHTGGRTLVAEKESAAVFIDTCDNPVITAPVVYDSTWIADILAEMVVTDDGETVRRVTGSGSFTWDPERSGRHTLVYTPADTAAAGGGPYEVTVFARWKYTVENGEATIVDTAMTEGDVVIPAEIDGYPVVRITNGLFRACTALRSVDIPDSVYDIGTETFADCTALETASLPSALKTQVEAGEVFAGCPGELQIDYREPEITVVTAVQRYPWNGKVDLAFSIVGNPDAGLRESNYPVPEAVATDLKTGKTWTSAVLSGDTGTEEGMHRVVWDMDAEDILLTSTNVAFRIDYVSPDGTVRFTSADAPAVTVDNSEESIVDTIDVVWDASWIGGDPDATVVITDNGREVKRAGGSGVFTLHLDSPGRHTLVYTTFIDGVACAETLETVLYARWKYRVDDGCAVITGAICTTNQTTLPPVIDGYPVTGADEGALDVFAGKIDCFTLPAAFTRIGTKMFYRLLGSQNWVVDNRYSDSDYIAYIKPGVLASRDLSILTYGSSSFTFDWYVNCDESRTGLQWFLDDSEQDRISGTNGIWRTVSVSVPSGQHRCSWRYTGSGIFDSSGAMVRIPRQAALPFTNSVTVVRSDYPFAFGGDAIWTNDVADASGSYDGSLKSGKIGDNGSTWMETTVPGPGRFSFKWMASSDYDADGIYDYGFISVNGVPLGARNDTDKTLSDYAIGGDASWQDVTLELNDTGPVTVRWTFVKDGEDRTPGEDCIRVDCIGFTPKSDGSLLPDLGSEASSADVSAVLDSWTDAGLAANVTNAAEYAAFRSWALTLTDEALALMKNSPYAWLSYALAAESPVAAAPAAGDVVVDAFAGTATEGAFDLTVNLADVTVGEGATEANLRKTFVVEGTSDLETGEFSSDSVRVDAVTPDNGKVRFTVTPAAIEGALPSRFFIRVKMK